jgi:hypothetical protein
MQSVTGLIFEPAREVTPLPRPWSRITVITKALNALLQNAFRTQEITPPVADAAPVTVETPHELPRMDYTPVVKGHFGGLIEEIMRSYASNHSDYRVRGMNRYFQTERPRQASDSYRTAVNRGSSSAQKHLSALVNFAVLTNPELDNLQIQTLLLNSYGTAVSPFMMINQEYFGRFLETRKDSLYIEGKINGVHALTVNPEVVCVTELAGIAMITPDWDKIFNLPLRLGKYISIDPDFAIKASELEVHVPTVGCPFQNFIKQIYPGLVSYVTSLTD